MCVFSGSTGLLTFEYFLILKMEHSSGDLSRRIRIFGHAARGYHQHLCSLPAFFFHMKTGKAQLPFCVLPRPDHCVLSVLKLFSFLTLINYIKLLH
jgi:hypothetical protein